MPQTTDSILEFIRQRQIEKMPTPPQDDAYFTDLGLFLIYFKNLRPNETVMLLDCEFMGLLPRDDAMMLVARASFELEDLEQPIMTKGCFFTELNGDDLYNAIPGKGEPVNIKASIPSHFFRKNPAEDGLSVRLLRGRYHEEFLPLLAQELEQL